MHRHKGQEVPPPHVPQPVSSRVRIDLLARRWPVAVALLASAVVFHPLGRGLVFGGHLSWMPPFKELALQSDTGALSDIEVVMLPFLCHAKREWAAGRVPLWNPYGGLGVPFLANQQSAVLHPVTLLGLILPWRYTLTVIVLFRWSLAFVGSFVLARRVGCGREGAAIAAVAYSLCGSIVVWIGYPVGGVFAHVPLLLSLASRPIGSGCLLVMVLLSSLLTGHFEYLPIV